MTTFTLRYFKWFLLAAVALLGLSFGHLGASVVEWRLRGLSASSPPLPATVRSNRPLRLSDYEVILQRSLFAPELAGKYSLAGGSEKGGAPPRASLILLGTVAGGIHPLALVRIGAENRILHVGDTLADGGRVIEIARQQVRMRYPDGSEELVVPPEIPPAEVASGAVPNGPVARATGDNRWTISRNEAEKARANLGEILKQARMEPHLVDGRTDGFEVKMVKPNTIFTTLGIQKGDIVRQVNGLALDSPEKALQIFQQLREARHIVIALERGGAPMSFSYDLE